MQEGEIYGIQFYHGTTRWINEKTGEHTTSTARKVENITHGKNNGGGLGWVEEEKRNECIQL